MFVQNVNLNVLEVANYNTLNYNFMIFNFVSFELVVVFVFCLLMKQLSHQLLPNLLRS